MTAQLEPSPDPRTAIGIDIGGTKIAAGLVTEHGQLLNSHAIPTPQSDGTEIVDALLSLIEKVTAGGRAVEALGVGAAGLVDWPTGYIRWAPNIPYRELPLRDILAQRTGLPTIVENDANAAAAAEARFGAGYGYSDSITLTIGTGVGGGIVVNGQLFRGRTGIGAEIGHIIVNPMSGPRCNCGSIGCLEAMASGTALGKAGRVAAERDPTGTLAGLADGSGNVTGEIVFAAARQGDQTARELFNDLGYWIGIGIASLVTIFDPEVVILGGGIPGAAGDLLFMPTTATFERSVSFRDHRALPAILPARLGAQAGPIGAGALALDHRSAVQRPR